MNKRLKKVLKISGISLLVLLALAFIIPIVFKKQITNLVKKEINKALTAKVDFKDASLSLFRHFPRVAISVSNISIVGNETFTGDTLLAAKSIDVSANLISIIKGDDIKVGGVYLESPRIFAKVNKDGQPNWDIVRSDGDTTNLNETDTASSPFSLQLKEYAINDGYIKYSDDAGGMYAEIVGLNHKGSGNFNQDAFTLFTDTKTDAVNFTYAGVPYLVNTKTNIDAEIAIESSNNKYSFKTDDIALNNLKLSAGGFIQLVNDSTYNMDISFKTPSNEFKDILSLIPAIYKTDFDKIKTDGKAALEGFVKGIYSPAQLPAYDVKLNVTDGSFQYPDLPKPVKNIQIALHASNPDGQLDNTVIDLSKGHLEMDNAPFDFRFLLKQPETIQYIDAAAKGNLDLAQLSQFIKLEGNTKLSGKVNADIFAKGAMKALTTQSGNFSAGGFLDVANLFYSSSDFPQPISNGNMKIQIANTGGVADNTNVNITNGHIQVGQDPINFNLDLSNPMTAINFKGNAKGRFTLDNVKQFVSFEPGTLLTGLLNADVQFAGNKTAIDNGQYDKINLLGTASLQNVSYTSPDYPTGVKVPVVAATFNTQNVNITQLTAQYLGSNFNATGLINNLIGYAIKDEPLKGSVNLAVDKMNLNKWMGDDKPAAADEKTETPSATTSAFVVPGNLNLTLQAKAGEVMYDKVAYKNINGQVSIADQAIRLQQLRTEALDGVVTLNGSYSTKVDKKEPDIAISYDVKDVDIQKTFLAFNTVQKLMPIGQFLAGKLNSQLTMTGNLTSGMLPDLSSLTGNGNLLLLEGALRKFAPLEKLANTLQIKELQSITLKDIKNTFEFSHGKVFVKPFTIKVQDIEMQIGGMHGIDQTIDYIIALKVPRKYIGKEANSLVNGLITQASNRGIPINNSEFVNLNVKMGGSLTNPTIKTDLKEVAGDAISDMKEQATEFAQAKIDSAKATIKDSVTAIKNQVVKDLKDEALKQILGNKDTVKSGGVNDTKKAAEKTVKNTLDKLLNKNKKTQPADTTKKD